METNKTQSLIHGISLIITGAILSYGLYHSINHFKEMDRFVSAKGLVERLEKADKATISITLTLKGTNPQELYNQISPIKAKLIAYYTKLGFEEKEIHVQSPYMRDLSVEYRNQGTPTPSDPPYILTVNFTIKSSNVDLAQETQRKSFDLLNEGVPITDSNISYSLEKFASMRADLIEAATKNARDVANGFAKTTGSKLGGIKTATQGPIQILSPDALPNQDWSNESNSMMKKIRLVSTIDFYIHD